jgi:hypothetical protein
MSSRKSRTMVEWHRIFGGNSTASVIPHGADSRTIVKELRGKVPGTRNKRTGSWAGTTGTVIDRFMTEAEARQADIDGAAVGIWGQWFPGGDIDVDDPELVEEILALMSKMLGPAPIRRREGSPRCLGMYTGENVRRRRIEWGGGENIKESAVEILGRGQYWNADGLHPSGKPYYWDTHPCDLGPYDITEITNDQVDAFITAVEALLARRGIVATIVGSKTAGSTGGVRTGLDDPSLWAPSPQAVIDLLAGYEPDVLGHLDFVAHMAAIKAALGEAREDFYLNVLEWAPGVRSTEFDATRKVWDSVEDAAVGWNWLVDKSGSATAATADFKDAPPDDDTLPVDPREILMREIRKRWVYDVLNDCFHDTSNVMDISKDSFNVLYSKSFNMSYGRTGPRTPAAQCLNDEKLIKVYGSTYAPGGRALVINGTRTLVNRWRPSDLKRRQGDPEPWLTLIEKLFPDPMVRDHVLDFIAFVVQNPGKKIGHAMLWYSQKQGVGKDTALDPLLHIIGVENVARIEPEELGGQFTSYLAKQLIVCNEMMNLKRNSSYNQMKSFLEMSSNYLVVNPKYGKRYEVSNTQIWIFCSNHANAISLETGDRRVFVCQCPSEALPTTQADEIYEWYAKDDNFGRGVVFDFLMKRDISKFNPARTPPMTAAKSAMIELAKSEFHRWADKNFGHRKFVTASEIQEAGIYGGNIEVSRHSCDDASIVRWLRTNGFEALSNRIRIEKEEKTTVWAHDPTPEVKLAGDEFLRRWLMEDRKSPRPPDS